MKKAATVEEIEGLGADARTHWANWQPGDGQEPLGEDVQLLLAHDPDPGVRVALAANTSVLPLVQEVLAGDPYWGTRLALAANEALTQGVMSTLSADDDPEVVLTLVLNEALDPEAEAVRTLSIEELDVTAAGSRYASRALAAADVDMDTAGVLRGSWTGTLGELIETTSEFETGA